MNLYYYKKRNNLKLSIADDACDLDCKCNGTATDIKGHYY